MAGRSALITGGSSGIGFEVARALGRCGYGITIAARRPEKLEAAAESLRKEGVTALAVPAQMRDEQALLDMVSAHRNTYGRLDVLVNNAGVGIAQAADGVQTKHLDMQLEVNLRSAVIATRECLPMLRQAGQEHGKATIVNMASISGNEGWADLSVYSATKAGLIALSRAVQREVAGSGIQVTAFSPGFVDTPMTDAVPEDQTAMLPASDIARAVIFLLETSPACLVPELVLTPAGGNRHT